MISGFLAKSCIWSRPIHNDSSFISLPPFLRTLNPERLSVIPDCIGASSEVNHGLAEAVEPRSPRAGLVDSCLDERPSDHAIARLQGTPDRREPADEPADRDDVVVDVGNDVIADVAVATQLGTLREGL